MSANQAAEPARIGSWVKFYDHKFQDEEIVHLVEKSQANPTRNQIPPDSPFAQALLGAKPGETVSYSTPDGQAKVRILEVGRD